MTPQQAEQYRLVQEELGKSNLSEKKKQDGLRVLKKNPSILSLGFSTEDLITLATNNNAKQNVETAAKFTKDAKSLGYICGEIAIFGSRAFGNNRLLFVCQYHQYLKSKDFNKGHILAMINSKCSTIGMTLAIANFTTLFEKLKYKPDDIVQLVTYAQGSRLIRFVVENADKLTGLTPAQIYDLARLPSKRPKHLNLIEPPDIDELYENMAINAAKALLDDFNKTQTATTAISIALSTPSEGQEPAQKNSTQFHTTSLLTDLKERLHIALRNLPVKSEEEALLYIQELTPYLVKLSCFPVPHSIIAKIAILQNRVEIAKDLAEQLSISLVLGYKFSDLIEKVLRESGEIKLKELNRCHKELTKVLGFDNGSIIKIALGRPGLVSLTKLIHHSNMLSKLKNISTEDILEIANCDNSDKAAKALLDYYDLFISLGFSRPQIIRIAKSAQPNTCFIVLLACHVDICKHKLMTKGQLVDLILADSGPYKMCWLYFYIVKYVAEHQNTIRLVENVKKDFANMANVHVLPENYLGLIRDNADKNFKDFSSRKQGQGSSSFFQSTEKAQSSSSQENVSMIAPISNERKRKQETSETIATIHPNGDFGTVPVEELMYFPALPNELEKELAKELANQETFSYEPYSCFEPKKAQALSVQENVSMIAPLSNERKKEQETSQTIATTHPKGDFETVPVEELMDLPALSNEFTLELPNQETLPDEPYRCFEPKKAKPSNTLTMFSSANPSQVASDPATDKVFDSVLADAYEFPVMNDFEAMMAVVVEQEKSKNFGS